MNPNQTDPKKMSRRAVVASGMLATPVIMASATHAAAAADVSGTDGDRATGRPMRNPKDEFPKPPFPKQTQPWPGLASKMDPKPDHGETSYKGSGKLVGRKALITGGDSGMGRAAAIAYAREGADVAFGYLAAEEPDAKEVVELITSAGRKAVPLPGDIRDEAFCKKLVADAAKQLGGLDILVNNAAKQDYKEDFLQITTEQMKAEFETNVFAVMWITQAAMQHLKPGASIIVTASIQSYEPSPGIMSYAMTKACNMSFVKSLSKHLAPKGIRVNGVAPGPIWTPLQPSGGQDPQKLPNFGKDTPLGRPGQPVELAPVYVFLASQESSYVSGEIYGITGGNPTA